MSVKQVLNLIDLVSKYPNLDIVPLVNTEIVASNEFDYWLGGWGSANLDEIYQINDATYFKSIHSDKLFHSIFDDIEAKNPACSDPCLVELADQEFNNIPWKKVIVVNIGLPSVSTTPTNC